MKDYASVNTPKKVGGLLAHLVLAVTLASGCAKKMIEKNEVSPDLYSEKSLFGFQGEPSGPSDQSGIDGKEFYVVRGVEDADSKNTVGVIPGTQFEYGIVKVRVTEDELQFLPVAGNEYFKFIDSLVEDKEQRKPIAAYEIDEHFDIVREENAYGEKTNVLKEEKKREWWKRQYMRVKWDEPKGQSWVHGSQVAFFGVAPEESNQAIITPLTKLSDGTLKITAETVMNPKKSIWSRYLDVILKDKSNSGSRVVFSTYFIPVENKRSDFEPVVYSDEAHKKFGLFRTNKVETVPGRGAEDDKIVKLANLFNVCPAGTLSAQTKKVRSCGTNKIVWHLADDYDESYLDQTRWVVAEWNRAFQEALGRKDTVVELNEERVSKTDPRYNVLTAYAPETSSAGLAGIAQWYSNPYTGEILSARANVFTFYLNGVRETVSDIIKSLTEEDRLLAEISGLPIPENTAVALTKNFLDKRNLAEHQKKLRENLKYGGSSGLAELASGKQSIDSQTVQQASKQARQAMNAVTRKVAALVTDSSRSDGIARRMRFFEKYPEEFRVRNSARITDRFLPRQILASESLVIERAVPTGMLGFRGEVLSDSDRLAPSSETIIKNALRMGLLAENGRKPANFLDPYLDENLMRTFENTMNIKDATFVEDAVVNFLISKVREYGKASDIGELKQRLIENEKTLRNEVSSLSFIKVMLHEMGHVFGLRHNFMGSSDIHNYEPTYDLISTCIATNSSDDACQVKHADGTVRSYNKWDLELFASSSIMDYHGSFIERGGVGPYDQAAIKFAYVEGTDPSQPLTKSNTLAEAVERTGDFKFCTDDQVGDDMFCERFDQGHNMVTKMQYIIGNYNKKYLRTHFRRNKAAFDYVGYSNVWNNAIGTMIDVRQAYDEFLYQWIYGEKDADGTPVIFSKSINNNELADIMALTEPGSEAAIRRVEGLARGGNFNDMSTWIHFLTDANGQPYKDPQNYIPMGFADLYMASEIATGFFVDIMGAPLPGYYLPATDSITGSRRLLTLEAHDGPFHEFGLSDGEIREKVEEVIRGNPALYVKGLTAEDSENKEIFEKKIQAEVEDRVKEVITIAPGQVARVTRSFSKELGAQRVLENVGFLNDKIAALLVLGSRGLGVSRYSERGMSGNAFLWPQTRGFTLAMYDKLINGEKDVTNVAVNTGKGVEYLTVEGDPDINVQSFAVVTGLLDFVTENDTSFLNKLTICKSSDLGCKGQFNLPVAEFVTPNGGDGFRAAQNIDGDSIAYRLVKKGQDAAEKLAKYETALSNRGAVIAKIEVERKNIAEAQAKFDAYKPQIKDINLLKLANQISSAGDDSLTSTTAVVMDANSTAPSDLRNGFGNFVIQRINTVTEQLNKLAPNNKRAAEFLTNVQPLFLAMKAGITDFNSLYDAVEGAQEATEEVNRTAATVQYIQRLQGYIVNM